MPALGLDPELERDPAQHQADQHRGDRKVQRAQHHTMRGGEGGEEQADAEHQPGFVRVPERADRADHQILLGALGAGHQHAHAEVVAVEHHVGEDRDPHQRGEDERQQLGVHFLAMCVRVTM